ncbi:hypothetical protein [Mycolicibacterium vinylchloridicum]|uniref:hypothetical protein n=1 Tax=Mycolicibacterium vinylchloridicum TaxID=2736928 RepID=UPI0015CCF3EC|nr:hypothetical protein [Mycolicibacterium vinylchloridicum]
MTGPHIPVTRPPITWLPAALMGAMAVIGLLSTLLPIWTLQVALSDLSPGLTIMDGDDVEQTVGVHFGFYTWIVANVPVAAVIPLTLAVAAAVAMTQAVSGSNRTLWGGTAALAVGALVLTASVAIRPNRTTSVTGPLAKEVSMRGLRRTVGADGDLGVGLGSGLIVALICLIAVLAIAAWQYVISSRPSSAAPPGMQPTQSP